MSLLRISFLVAAFLYGSTLAVPTRTQNRAASPPTVTLDNATVIGKPNGTVTQFLGLPYAQPPVGDLRLRLPKSIGSLNGTINATAFGDQCIQQTFPALSLPSDVPAAVGEYLGAFLQVPAEIPQTEDCLNLNVIVPANATPDSKLPVAVWIYGGGFEVGSNAVQPGHVVVARSIELGHPIVYVALNYRLSAFGFLGGKEVKEAGVGNLGLHDQREALRWVQKYISAFGGDPDKVMIWGESAGAMSVAFQMLYNNGDAENLFRAGFMESGSPFSAASVDSAYLQTTYDNIVADAGCAGGTDTLECLRTVPATVLKAAMDRSPSFVSYRQVNTPWFPRVDGVFIKESPIRQMLDGRIAKIPFVNGNDGDEGPAFAFPTLNITTDDEFLSYVNSNYFNATPRAVVAKVLELYPSNPAAGSPFGTGDEFAYSPQYKRMSAFQGDYIGQAPRRAFVQKLAESQPVYSYLSWVNQVDGIGAAHGTELTNIYGGGDMGDYLIRFAATLDPNGDGATHWPRYTKASPQLLTFNDSTVPLSLTLDTYRAEGMAYLTELSLADPM
ncbi:carotenoid ester lipase [Daedaleopsis nitida]|nr:carotenoid ester lipase [Daedaleopsis nitida]